MPPQLQDELQAQRDQLSKLTNNGMPIVPLEGKNTLVGVIVEERGAGVVVAMNAECAKVGEGVKKGYEAYKRGSVVADVKSVGSRYSVRWVMEKGGSWQRIMGVCKDLGSQLPENLFVTLVTDLPYFPEDLPRVHDGPYMAPLPPLTPTPPHFALSLPPFHHLTSLYGITHTPPPTLDLPPPPTPPSPRHAARLRRITGPQLPGMPPLTFTVAATTVWCTSPSGEERLVATYTL